VDIWGLHRLSDFLDNNPDGQYIRKEHFGIEAERLSEPLFEELSRKSIEEYQSEFHIRQENKVERPETSTILNEVRSPEFGSYFLPIIGNSGFGKTVICHQAMQKWCDEGGQSLRLSPEDIQDSRTLSQALYSALNRLHPSLNNSAGREAIKIAQKKECLLLVVDDLSRASNPRSLSSRILNWVGEIEDEDESVSTGINVTILCPIWPRIWNRVELDIDRSMFANIIELEGFSSDLSVQLIQSYAEKYDLEIEEREAANIAQKLRHDPHLIGLLRKLFDTESNLEDLPDTSREVLQEYVEFSYGEASRASDGGLIEPDFRLAVKKLSVDLLETREWEPTWEKLREWDKESDNLDEIRQLTTQAQLLILLEKRTENSLSFRHDRLRDYILSTCIFDLIQEDEELPEYVSDPYYYSIIGEGIAYQRPSSSILPNLCDQNPLALLEAIRELNCETPDYEETLASEFLDWLDDQGGYRELLTSLRGESLNILQETNSNQVLAISESFPDHPLVLLARFRNGDLRAGIKYCREELSPNTNNPQRDSVFEDAEQRWGDDYVDRLSKILSSGDIEHIMRAIELAGYLGRSELVPALQEVWEEYQGDERILPAFLWAAFQCGIPEDEKFVSQVIDRWDSLPSGNSIDDSTIEVGTGDIFMRVKFSLSRNISEAQVRYILEKAEDFSSIEHHLIHLLRKVPDPDTLEFVIRKRAENMRETDGVSIWARQLLDPWKPRTIRGKRPPSDVRERMKDTWPDETEVNEVRTSAFAIWAQSAQEEDLEQLRSASEDELLSYTADYHRLRLGDKTVIESFSIDSTKGHPQQNLLRELPNA